VTVGLVPPRDAASKPRWVPAYVALGSNLAEPVRQVERAFEALATLPVTRLMLRSSAYRSRPMGPVEQPDFVNAAAALLTQLDPATLLRELQSLETRLGREVPVVRWGPRLIDLDLLVHGQTRCNDAALTLPHPGIVERDFVLVPLAEISPSLEVPGVGRVDALLQRLAPPALERIPGAD
jgi:2-amino-4-hydroxy-6-hydroxymethyldihydropteridine diphosphokinase